MCYAPLGLPCYSFSGGVLIAKIYGYMYEESWKSIEESMGDVSPEQSVASFREWIDSSLSDREGELGDRVLGKRLVNAREGSPEWPGWYGPEGADLAFIEPLRDRLASYTDRVSEGEASWVAKDLAETLVGPTRALIDHKLDHSEEDTTAQDRDLLGPDHYRRALLASAVVFMKDMERCEDGLLYGLCHQDDYLVGKFLSGASHAHYEWRDVGEEYLIPEPFDDGDRFPEEFHQYTGELHGYADFLEEGFWEYAESRSPGLNFSRPGGLDEEVEDDRGMAPDYSYPSESVVSHFKEYISTLSSFEADILTRGMASEAGSYWYHPEARYGSEFGLAYREVFDPEWVAMRDDFISGFSEALAASGDSSVSDFRSVYDGSLSDSGWVPSIDGGSSQAGESFSSFMVQLSDHVYNYRDEDGDELDEELEDHLFWRVSQAVVSQFQEQVEVGLSWMGISALPPEFSSTMRAAGRDVAELLGGVQSGHWPEHRVGRGYEALCQVLEVARDGGPLQARSDAFTMN